MNTQFKDHIRAFAVMTVMVATTTLIGYLVALIPWT